MGDWEDLRLGYCVMHLGVWGEASTTLKCNLTDDGFVAVMRWGILYEIYEICWF